MTKYIAKELLEKYIQGTCTEEERAIVESWHLKELEGKAFRPKMAQVETAYENIWQGIKSKASGRERLVLKNRQYRYFAIAATILIIFSAGLFFIKERLSPPSITDLLAKTGKDFIPGGHKATLILADGSQISLTDALNGKLAQQAGITITKTGDGQLVYQVEQQPGIQTTDTQPLMNTISTPRGGQYQIALPDGSQVWLNAESSLKYPVNFNSKERKVELNGEAYFEVSKKQLPFIVVTDKQEVRVLGTHFNISNYHDEPVTKTTLLEGSVNVVQRSTGASRILKPGEQSSVTATPSLPSVVTADVETEMAWKNGLFIFKDEPIERILKDLARWYDVEISFEGKPTNLSYVGVVSRSKKISSVLKILEGAGNLQFRLEGKKIIVIN